MPAVFEGLTGGSVLAQAAACGLVGEALLSVDAVDAGLLVATIEERGPEGAHFASVFADAAAELLDCADLQVTASLRSARVC